jgi:hypothetical protein
MVQMRQRSPGLLPPVFIPSFRLKKLNMKKIFLDNERPGPYYYPEMDEETKARIKELVDQEIEPVVDSLRQAAVEVLERYVGPGLISPEDASVFIGRSYRQLYRWLGCRTSRLYLPQMVDVDAIVKFTARVDKISAAWTEVLASWRDPNSDLKRAFYNPRLVAIIESDASMEDKVSLLVKKTVHMLAAEMRRGE